MMDKFFYFSLQTHDNEKGVRDENIIPWRSSKGLSARHPAVNDKDAKKRRQKCQKNF